MTEAQGLAICWAVCSEAPHWAVLDLIKSVHCLRVSSCSLLSFFLCECPSFQTSCIPNCRRAYNLKDPNGTTLIPYEPLGSILWVMSLEPES